MKDLREFVGPLVHFEGTRNGSVCLLQSLQILFPAT